MNSESIIKNALNAKKLLTKSEANQRKQALRFLIEVLEDDRKKILKANSKDLSAGRESHKDAFLDRLKLDNERLDDILQSIKQVMDLPDLVGRIYDRKQQRSGIITAKMTTPIGVILMVYESRPNVTIDAAALSIKTANAIILKGGSEIEHTNKAFRNSISKALKKSGLHEDTVQVLNKSSRKLLPDLLRYDQSIDLLIPRGSRRLLEFVQENSKIPMLMHLEGNCHIYVDKKADIKLAQKILIDAKLQRTGTCNTVESLLVHKEVAGSFLPALSEYLQKKGVEIRGDKEVCEIVKFANFAKEDDWAREYLAPIISIKVVNSADEAINHINIYGSGHTDSIITKDQKTADKFLREVDSSSVMVNTSTRLADGFEYGLGAEIGISTNKLHARGPVGQQGLLTYKWIVESNGITKGDIVNS